jgi:SAM-dependent methyltransferase
VKDWEQIFSEKGFFFTRPEREVRAFASLLGKEGARRVLDLGCGTGRHSVLLARMGFEVWGMDVSPTALRLARRWLAEEGLKARLVRASAFGKFPFRDGFFDALLSNRAMHHGRRGQVESCAREVARVVRSGGLAWLTVTSRASPARSGREYRFVSGDVYEFVRGDEEGVPHYAYTKEKLRTDFSAFRPLKLERKGDGGYLFLARRK